MPKIKMKFLIPIILLFLYTPLNAGDYELFITTLNSTNCQGKELKPYVESCENATWRPLCGAHNVAEDLKSYFSGNNPTVKFLVSAFGNGHVTFCTEEAETIISETLQTIKANGTNKRGRHLEDFILVNDL